VIGDELDELIHIQRSEHRVIVDDPAERQTVRRRDSVSHQCARALDCRPRRFVIEAALRMDRVGRTSTVRPIVEDASEGLREWIAGVLLGTEPSLSRFGNAHRNQRGEPLLDEREMLENFIYRPAVVTGTPASQVLRDGVNRGLEFGAGLFELLEDAGNMWVHDEPFYRRHADELQSASLMNVRPALHEKHQFRLVLCGHKAVEIAAVCVLLMVQGDLAGVTLTHLGIASQTGLLGVLPLLGVTFTQQARILSNRWASSSLVAVCTFIADSLVHASHYPGAYTEAALTAAGAFLFSAAISFTPLGKRIDRLAEAFVHHRAVAC
jgi:hypothetical protein